MGQRKGKRVFIEETGEVFNSVAEAAKELGYCDTSLSAHLSGKDLLAIGSFLTIYLIPREKTCPKCEIELTSENCNLSRLNDGDYACNKCKAKYVRERRKKQKAINPEQFYKEQNKAQRKFHKENPGKMREYFLKNIYGLTVNEYDKLFFEQKGLCAICGKPETSKNQYGIRRLNIDHNHISGKNRGLLCSKHNLGIGQFNIDEQGIELLLKAIEYVEKYQ